VGRDSCSDGLEGSDVNIVLYNFIVSMKILRGWFIILFELFQPPKKCGDDNDTAKYFEFY
jgi:hypothetical protein